MNGRERFFTTLRKEEPDFVPIIDLKVDKGVIEKIMPGASMLDFYNKIDLDGIVIVEDIDWKEVSTYTKRDHFGVLRDFRELEDVHWPFPVEPLIKKEQDINEFLDKYKMPDSSNENRYKTLKTAVKMFKGEKAVIFAVWQAFLYPSLIRGFENMLMDYIVNPVAIKRLINLVTDYFSEQEKIALEIGADAIIDGEDYCSKSGPFMSIHHFEEFCLPGLQRVINIAKDRGAPFLKHCDGNIWPIIDIIINSGIDSLNPIEPAAGMDIGEVKKIYGKKITVHGNIDCAHLLTFGKPEDVRLAVKECIKKASPGGGHILSSSNIIHKGVPPENFMAMIKSGREFGEYPIKIE